MFDVLEFLLRRGAVKGTIVASKGIGSSFLPQKREVSSSRAKRCRGMPFNANGVDVCDFIGQVTEIAPAAVCLWVPIVGELDLRCVVTGGTEEDERKAASLRLTTPHLLQTDRLAVEGEGQLPRAPAGTPPHGGPPAPAALRHGVPTRVLIGISDGTDPPSAVRLHSCESGEIGIRTRFRS